MYVSDSVYELNEDNLKAWNCMIGFLLKRPIKAISDFICWSVFQSTLRIVRNARETTNVISLNENQFRFIFIGYGLWHRLQGEMNSSQYENDSILSEK